MQANRSGKGGAEVVAPEESARHRVDVHVGALIKARRKNMGISQAKLADALGLTFQQIQKYENGQNRISASKLWETAAFLQCSVSDLFAGLEQNDAEGGLILENLHAMGSRYGFSIARDVRQLSPRVQKQIADLVEALVTETAG